MPTARLGRPCHTLDRHRPATLRAPRVAVERLQRRRRHHRGDWQAGAPARDRTDEGRRDQDRRLFASSSGTLRDPENFNTAWRAVRDELGMPDVTSHSFRKTVATLIDDA